MTGDWRAWAWSAGDVTFDGPALALALALGRRCPSRLPSPSRSDLLEVFWWPGSWSDMLVCQDRNLARVRGSETFAFDD